MEVYRVQHPVTGQGPYAQSTRDRCPKAWAAVEPHYMTGDESHPSPWCDGLASWHRELSHEALFGFVSKWSLRRWFPKAAREAFAEDGLELIVLNVPASAVRRGGKQCVFDPGLATLAGRLDPVTLEAI